MKIKCFYPDKDGNIILTKEELEKLLNDVYEEGRADANKNYITTTRDYYPYITPYVTYNSTPPIDTTPYVYCTDTNSIGTVTLESIKGDEFNAIRNNNKISG